MKDLLAALGASDDEHGNYGIVAVEGDWRANSLSLHVTVGADESRGAKTTEWVVTCTGVLDHRLTIGVADGFEWTSGPHPLLWPHVEDTKNLYLASKATNVAEVIGLLLVAHQGAVCGWLPPERFFNTETRLTDLLRGGFGLLARAPASLAGVYAEVLGRVGIRWSEVETGLNRTWNPANSTWVPVDPARLSVLTLGESFVVASAFAASSA